MKRAPTSPHTADRTVPDVGHSDGELAARRPYRAPRVTPRGAMTRIALGGTPGVGESGSAGTRKPPG